MSFIANILSNLEQSPKRASLIEIHGKEKRASTGTEILALIARVRAFVRAAGTKPGERVALLAPNSTRWVAADLGILTAGAIAVPLYARQDPKELAVMMRDAAPTLVIAADEELASALAGAWPEHCRIALFDDVFATEPDAEPPHDVQPPDDVSIIYTSGTSGVPKGVVFTRESLDFMLPKMVARLGTVVGDRGGAPDEVLHYLPFCFAASRLFLWMQLSRPNPLMMSTDLTNLIEEMGTAKPHYFLNVPALLERIRSGVANKLRERGGLAAQLYEAGQAAFRKNLADEASFKEGLVLGICQGLVFPKIKRQIGPRLEFLISGSAPLSEETQRWFEMIGVPVYQAYGLTETTGIVSIDEPNAVVPGRVGHVIDGVDVRVGENEELLVRGPNVFRGYWNKPEETTQAIRDGWFHTGDQVDIEDGNLKIIGRVKNLIIPESGHNIAPEPIEQKFMDACPGAEQCMLVGHARPFVGIIVTGEVAEAAIEKALEMVNAGLPHYKRIRKFHRAGEPFSIENGLLTANQKLKRRVIESHFEDAIAQMYQ